ncbi:hypothetical protein YH62_19395 [Rhizobium sp. LC145]|nr:hypothetical protein YH62_19395 [Rhizobium sp. LC145]
MSVKLRSKRRLPINERLRAEAAKGYGLAELSDRYHVSIDHMRRHLKRLGINIRMHGSPSPRDPSEPAPDRFVVEKRVTAAEFGGTKTIRISLPRISMHVAYVEGRP